MQEPCQVLDERTRARLLSSPKHGGLQTKDERRDEIGEVRRLGFVIQETEPIEFIR